MLRLTSVLTLAFCGMATLSPGQVLSPERSSLPRAAPENVGLSPVRLREATELLNQFVLERKISGAVAAVARRGRLAYLEAVGLQDLDARAPMAERSLFRIYSMTKSVTAVAVMMLYEEGHFRLTDPVSKYLPAFREVAGTRFAGWIHSPAFT